MIGPRPGGLVMRKCVLRDCENRHRARGFCANHYEQWHRYGMHSQFALPKTVRKGCKIEGCYELSEANGMCQPHYRKWRRSEGLDKAQTNEYASRFQRSYAGRWAALKRAAKDKSLGFDITKKQHVELLQEVCFYCEGKLNETGHALDRKDSSKGYLLSNVVPCCMMCNRIKNEYLTHEEMLVAMKAVLAYRKKRPD